MLNFIMQAPAAGQQPNILASIFPFILIGFVFYFLLIRPQNKRMKEHKAMLGAVTRGDTVVTSGGLIGKVVKVSEGELTLDVGDGQKVKVVSTMLADVRNKTVAANDTAKKPK
jgi:preprotein translocase subunit YajC